MIHTEGCEPFYKAVEGGYILSSTKLDQSIGYLLIKAIYGSSGEAYYISHCPFCGKSLEEKK